MKKFNLYIATILSAALIFGACHDLDELNDNPNGPLPEVITNPNFLLPPIIIQTGQRVVELGIGDLAGVMQHTQKNGWGGGHNSFDWDNDSHSWQAYYANLRQINEVLEKAIDGGYEFHHGAALVMKAYNFGLIADLWGDAPYSQALQGGSGSDFYMPVFDAQKDIYLGVLADLEMANTLLSKSAGEYLDIKAQQDVLYQGNVSRWRKFANSLALRYYMRLSAKEPSLAEDGINKIAYDPDAYPLITNFADDANVSYVGSSQADSWPINMVYNRDEYGEYMRRKMASTLVNTMQALDDPRLGIWAEKVEVPVVLVAGTQVKEEVNGEFRVSQDVVDEQEELLGVPVDFDPEYVGLPPAMDAPSAFNFAPDLAQGAYNSHVSQLAPMYKQASGPLLLMRLMSAAEVHFILAEAALNSWAPGDAETHFENGIRESLKAWGVGAQADDYIDGLAFTGLESIIEQKWIASWTAAAESWFDYRRTGFPDLPVGNSVKREAFPLRFYYHFNHEISRNTSNAEAAISRLEPTQYKGADVSNNSAWSKMWLLQGTNEPY